MELVLVAAAAAHLGHAHVRGGEQVGGFVHPVGHEELLEGLV